MSEKFYYLAFSQLFEFIGPLRFKKLLDQYGTAEAAWSSLRLRDIESLGILGERSARLEAKKKNVDLKALEKQLSSSEVTVLCDFEPEFPANLKNIPNCPFVIYVRGQILPQDAKAVAIVGTRKISSYGNRVIETLVPGLVNAGVSIVSGLAFGVDAKTAEETLAAGGRTIAVLASGVDQITPRSNELLGQRIIQSGGAIVSELPIGTTPQNYYFPIRNRIISGLSLGTIVIEAAEKSGALHTANFCGEQGRVIMAVPGSIFSEVSGGTNQLIRDGAGMVTKANDVLEELDIAPNTSNKTNTTNITNLSPVERQIFDLLTRDQLPIDALIRALNLPSQEVSVALTMLQLKGLVRDWGAGIYGI